MLNKSIISMLLFCLTAIFAAGSHAAQIENEHLIIAFNNDGNLTRIYNKASHTEYYHGAEKQILTIRYLENKATKDAVIKAVSVKSKKTTGGGSLTMQFAGEGITVDVVIRAMKGNPKTQWDLSISNVGSREVVEVVFPDLANMQIGGNASDDFLVRPNRYGEKIPNPSENLFRETGEIVNGLKYQGWWVNPQLEYSGEAGMFWMDLYDATGGLYLASEDKSSLGGFLANSETGKIGMSLGKYLHVKNGQTFKLSYAVGVHTGDWHWGADRYREWASTFMRKASIPRWVREMPNWYWVASIWSMGQDRPKLNKAFNFSDLDGMLYTNALTLGSNVVGLAGIEFMGHDYPVWWPDPSMGSEDTIRQGTANVKRRGGKIVPYLNPIYSWEDYPKVPHPENPEFQERLKQIPSDILQPTWDIYKNDYAMKYDGTSNYVEFHYHGNYPQMCQANKEWQDYMLWWTHKYAVDYGFSGVQWDQLGAYPDQYCVNWEHGHQHGGAGSAGTLELCKRIYNDPKYKVDPDFYIWYEGASDIFSQYLQNCHSGYDAWMAWSFPEMIQYTFPHNFYSGEYFDDPTLTGPALIRNRRSVELSVLGRYKLGTGTSGPHAFKVSKLAPMLNAVKGVYWYTDFNDNLGCVAPEGVWTKVLEINPKICPYIAKDGYIIPYVDVRQWKGACDIRLSRDKYNLDGISKVYWYPSNLQGLRQEMRFSNTGRYLSVRLPEDTGMNVFTRDQAYCKADDSISSVGMLILVKEELKPISIIAPLDVKRGEPFTVRTVVQTITGDGPSVSADFTAGTFDRLKPIDFVDGAYTNAVRNEVKCIEIEEKQSPYLYLDVMDSSLLNERSILEVKVRYLDEGIGTFRVQYNSTDMYAVPNQFPAADRNHKSSTIQHKRGTGLWRTVIFTLPDAQLTGAMNGGADIRVHTIDSRLSIAKVTVTRKTVKETPIPGVELSIGNDKRKSDANGMLKYAFSASDPLGTYYIDAYKGGKSGYLPANGVISLNK
ncbi:MAG: DUF6259 domain-containing protein [Armatimonadota bacterium]